MELHADNDKEAIGILILIGLGAFALILSGIIYLIICLIEWLKWRKL